MLLIVSKEHWFEHSLSTQSTTTLQSFASDSQASRTSLPSLCFGVPSASNCLDEKIGTRYFHLFGCLCSGTTRKKTKALKCVFVLWAGIQHISLCSKLLLWPNLYKLLSNKGDIRGLGTILFLPFLVYRTIFQYKEPFIKQKVTCNQEPLGTFICVHAGEHGQWSIKCIHMRNSRDVKW